MTEQTSFDFAVEPSTQQDSYPYPIAFAVLSMMAGEAVFFLEELCDRATTSGESEMAALATRAIAALCDEPTRRQVQGAVVHHRARSIGRGCQYG